MTTIQTPGHVDKVLSNIAIGFSQQDGFIADKIFPVVKVENESDLYYLFGRERFRPVNTYRARGAEPNEWYFGNTTASYRCEENALATYIDDRDYDNFDSPLDPEGDAVEGLTEVLQLGFEKDVANICRSTSTYPDATHYNNVTAAFDTGGSSITIQKDIQTLQEAVRAKIARWPNTIVIPPQVAFYMSIDDEIKDIVKYYINRSGIDGDMLVRGPGDSWLLPTVLWGMRVLVPLAMEDANPETQVANPTSTLTNTLSDLWGDDIWLGYVETSPGIKKVSFGYTFEQRPFQTKKWREEKRESNAIRVDRISVRKVVCSAAGGLLQGCLTSI